MNADENDQDRRWQRMFPDDTSVDAEMSELAYQKLQETTAKAFNESRRSVHITPSLSPVFVSLAAAASLLGLVWWNATDPIPEATVEPRSMTVVVSEEVGESSCWRLRSAFGDSEDTFLKLLDERLLARRMPTSRSNVSAHSFFLEPEWETK